MRSLKQRKEKRYDVCSGAKSNNMVVVVVVVVVVVFVVVVVVDVVDTSVSGGFCRWWLHASVR